MPQSVFEELQVMISMVFLISIAVDTTGITTAANKRKKILTYYYYIYTTKL